MKYKMIVLDLDGTLLDDKKNISHQNKKVLNTLHQMNIQIAIATGRTFRTAKHLLADLEFDPVIFSNNGSLVRRCSDDKKIFYKYIDINLFYKVLDNARKYNLCPILHVDHFKQDMDVLFEKGSINNYYKSYTSNPASRYKIMDNLAKYTHSNILLILFLGDIHVLKDFNVYINKNYTNKLKSHIITSLKNVGPILEVMNAHVSKWNSIKYYAQTLNITPDEIITIGDDNNDLEMVSNAGLGIAMKNATQPLLNSAKKISAFTNNQDGVAHVLKEIYSDYFFN